MSDRTLSRYVEEALAKSRFTFLKGQALNVTEYEVTFPHRFLVTVENLAREQLSLGFRSPVRVESSIEVKRKIGAREPEQELRRTVAEFLAALRETIPSDPWKGIGVVGSGIERSNWENLAEI